MADYHPSLQGPPPTDLQQEAPRSSLASVTNLLGALVSLALIIGVAVWGYRLMVRDVSGIPVVQAAEGDHRVRPEDPGGFSAQNQGLSVNRVASHGAAEGPVDQVRLAPEALDLAPEDHLLTASIEQPAPLAVSDSLDGAAAEPADVASALQSGNVDDLVAQLTAGVAPISGEEVVQDPEITKTVAAELSAAQAQIAALREAPGTRRSLRPRVRPVSLATTPTVTENATFVANSVQEIDPETLPKGTRLAQLGAFDSAEVARSQWEVLSGRFGTYMEGKSRVVQKATSGGRVFYRLRAHGFADIGEARRFCSALVAERADCIPVVIR